MSFTNLDKWQKDFLDTKGDKILCTGRQVGKTTVCAIDCIEWAMKTTKTGIISITAPQEFQAETLFTKILDYLIEYYPTSVKKGKDRPTKTQIRLRKGITIRCKTAGVTGFGLRSMTTIRNYVDECAQMPEMCWEAIDPQNLTTGGDTIYLSTPFGMQGRFYECWTNKDKAYDSFTRFSIDSEECMKKRKITNTWTKDVRAKALLKVEQARKRMTQKRFMQEYMGEFIEDLMQFFPDKLVQSCMGLQRKFRPNKDYYLGVDVGGRGGDESTFEILERREDGHLYHVESVVETYDMTTMTERQIIHLDNKWHFQKIYIDSTGIGVGVFDHLLENEQTKKRVVSIENAQRALDQEKNRRKKLLKEDLYNNLLCLMERGEISLLDDPEIFQSFKSVQFEITETKNIKIYGNYTHIVEGLIRAAWCQKEKINKVWIR